MVACSATTSRIVRMSRIGTPSSNRLCSTFCRPVSEIVFGTRSSVSFGDSLAMRSSSDCTSWRPSSSEACIWIRWFRWVATTVLASTTV
ncbi:hypothetical protein D3C87_1566900 [compost metagenome]